MEWDRVCGSCGWMQRAGGEGCAAVVIHEHKRKRNEDEEQGEQGDGGDGDGLTLAIIGGANGEGQLCDDAMNAGVVIANIDVGKWEYYADGEAPCARTGHTCTYVTPEKTRIPSKEDDEKAAVASPMLLVLGGCSMKSGYLPLSTVHVFDINEKRWREMFTNGNAPHSRDKHVCFTMPGDANGVYVFGGFGPDQEEEEEEEENENRGFAAFKWFNDLYRLDVTTWTWKTIETRGSTIPAPRAAAATCVLLGNESLLLFGGRGAAGRLGDTFTLEKTTCGGDDQFIWKQLATNDAPAPRSFHAMQSERGGGGGAFLFGGIDAENNLCNDVNFFDARCMKWQRIGTKGDCEPRAGAALASIGDMLVVIGGYTESSFFDDVLRLQKSRPV